MRVKMRNGIRPYWFYRRVGKKRNLQTNQLPFDRSRYNSRCVCVCVCVFLGQMYVVRWFSALSSISLPAPPSPSDAIVWRRSCMTDATKEETLIL